jgi:hypothetical protein
VHEQVQFFRSFPKFSFHQVYEGSYFPVSWPGSSVCVATEYGLGGLEIKSQWGRDFSHLSRPGLGPTQPLVQWVLGGKEWLGRAADHSPPSSAVVMEE